MDAFRNDPADGEPLPEVVLADDRLVEAIRDGRRGPDDPDPLVCVLARWRQLVRRPRTARHTALRRCAR